MTRFPIESGMTQMQRKIKIDNEEISYRFLKRRGNKNIRISIYPDGRLTVSAPKWCSQKAVNEFIDSRKNWIFDNLRKVNPVDPQKEKEEYEKYKNLAREIVEKKIAVFNEHYKFPIGKVYIRNQRTCWGSCSGKRNLSFSYKVIKLPDYLSDYVVVHETCHLKELNHSSRFWNLVSETIPDYKELRKELRKIQL